MKNLIAQGAEAKLYRSDDEVIKERIKKNYRIPEIDVPLRRRRTRLEASLLSRATRAGIPVPKVLEVDEKAATMRIEFLDGPKVRDYLTKANVGETCREIGRLTAKMHSADIVHADLTTSNMIVKDNSMYIIDFGLGEFSKRVEDKAVDVHLFKECLKSKHFDVWEQAWEAFEQGYKKEEPALAKDVFERLIAVEARGRYKGKI